MMLTLTIEQNHKESFDIQVPSGQRIGDTLRVLYENHLIDLESDITDSTVHSVRRNTLLDLGGSYEQNAIYTADILKIC